MHSCFPGLGSDPDRTTSQPLFCSGAAEAIKIQKEKKKLSNKRRHEFLQEQKQKRVARLKQIQSTKLPDDILNSLSADPPPAAPVAASTGVQLPPVAPSQQSRKKVFNSDAEEEGESSGGEEEGTKDYLALDTKSTRFEVVAPKDLRSDRFKNAAAWSFRQKMLFGDKRVRREDHKQKRIQAVKQALGGRDGLVRAVSAKGAAAGPVRSAKTVI